MMSRMVRSICGLHVTGQLSCICGFPLTCTHKNLRSVTNASLSSWRWLSDDGEKRCNLITRGDN